MDQNALHDEVMQEIFKSKSHKLQFSFNFGMIRKDPRFSKESYKNKYNKFMIIEVKCENKKEIYHAYCQILSTLNNIKILGVNMRMVPILNKKITFPYKDEI